ncbi:acyl-CoA/acyl-ACP dehydrogenase [Sphingomonas sp. SUN019]|uniref:acyl-CoA dehydrogenase family protein n=1 Tax=Sphingomonas sp. SUN019 TaxID=2937788 RepID=UPI0021649AEA|nr:acyl-CoA dehydrogenase family protein [Sphingomonas sp. SUN019]UVO49987.1 acyl-CoA/acyl-ACP dehydrogenase [Sphingomonas sp. SUN019]
MTDTLLRHSRESGNPLPASAPPSSLSAEDRTALIDQVRRLLADRCTEADVRRIMDSESGHDPALWRSIADLGLPGLTIPDAHGGAGLGPVELELVMEEAGASLLPAPLLSTALATALLQSCGHTAPLADIASGARIATVAFSGANDWTGAGDVRVAGDRLTGTARFVTDAQIADLILLATDDGVFLVEASDATITPLPTFDHTRRLADVRLDGPASRIGDAAAVKPALDLAIVALAGEQAGAARRLLDMTVDYARTRHQFGRAIGSFQAIKHMAADLLIEVESATSAARNAAQKLADDAPDKDSAIALAAFACADAFVKVAADAIQMHGGIAFTWDHPAHLYLRRARADAILFGTPDHWRERFIRALEVQA